MKIGELSRKTGLTRDSIRFYEKEGLLTPDQRTHSGYRDFTEAAVTRILAIRRARELGFTLPEIAELLQLAEYQQGDAKDVHERALHKLADLDRRIQALQRMRDSLAELAQACGGHGPRSSCPILESLNFSEGPKGRLKNPMIS